MKSIRTRLLLATTLLLVIVLAGIVGVVSARERQQIARFQREKALALASGIRGDVAVMLIEQNWNQLRALEKDLLLANDDTIYVLVSDARRNDTIVAALPTRFAGQIVPDMVETSVTDTAQKAEAATATETYLLGPVEFPEGQARGARGEPIVELSVPIHEGNGPGAHRIGTLRMGVSLRDIDRAVRTSIEQVAAIGLTALILGIAGSYALARRISAPILELRSGADRIASGQLTQRVAVRGSDEVSALAGSFNQMAASLSLSFARLEGTLASFERFVPNKFLSVVAVDGVDKIKVGSFAERRLTILFSDIRGYTTLSEGTPPLQVFHMLNDYLERVGKPIAERGGFIDKYIGDAVMALFDDEHTDGALDAAMAMRDGLEDFNVTSSAAGRPHLATGIGIHRGDVIMGTVGFSDKIDSTVIGDAVNLASRVEGLTKQYGCTILITADVVDALAHPERFVLRVVDGAAKVKGKEKPIALYELVSHAMEAKDGGAEAADMVESPND